MGKLTRSDLIRMMIMRSLGYSQEEIANHLGITQNTVSYYLKKFREKAQRDGPTTAFWSLVFGPLGAPAVLFGEVNKILSELEEEERANRERKGGGM